MKHIALSLFMACSLSVAADTYTFDFNHPTSLNPSVAEPAQKGFVLVNGRSFTTGPVEVNFVDAEYGNTHARIFHSYDAGIDLRIYDGDAMTVKVPDNMILKEITFTMSLSGNATGTNDINFIPDSGDFIWEDEKWIPDSEVSSVELVSAEQSRIYTMTVSVEPCAGIAEFVVPQPDAQYFNLLGRRVSKPTVAGIYFEVRNGVTRKIRVR